MTARTPYETFMHSQPETRAIRVSDVEGEVPPALRGTLLRNGGGVFEVGPDTLNFFDGHGVVAGLSFGDGAMRLRAAVVETPLWKASQAKGRMAQRGVFTNLPGAFANVFKLVPGNPCNHDVYAFGGAVYASNDGGHAALDATTLATVGEERWGSLAPAGTLMAPMPRVDPESGRLVAWVQTQKPGKPDVLRFVELDASRKVVRQSEPVTLGAGPVIVHGHAFSSRWYVCAELPARLSVLPALLGTKTIFESFAIPPGQTPALWLVPREPGGKAVRVQVPGDVAIIFHCLNAWDDGDRVVLDCVSYDAELPFDVLAPAEHLRRIGRTERVANALPRLVRHVIAPADGRVVETRVLADVPSEALDMDRRFRGKKHRFLYGSVPDAAGDEPAPGFFGYFHGLARFDTETGTVDRWTAGASRLCSPPAFAARPSGTAEGDGWLLTWVIDGADGNTSVLIHDAREIAKGPVATVRLGVPLPGVIHSNFEPAVSLA